MAKNKGFKKTTEIKGILLITLSLLLLLCLLSYSPQDNSYTYYASNPDKVKNLIGTAGSHTAAFLILLFGGSVFFLPLVFFIAGIRYLVSNAFRIKASHVMGCIGLILSTSALLTLTLKEFAVSGTPLQAGGLLGFWVTRFLNGWLSVTGTALVSAALLIISPMIMSNFSVVLTAKILSRLTAMSWFRTHGLFSALKKRLSIHGTDKDAIPVIKPAKEDPPSSPSPREEKQKAEQASFDFIPKRAFFRLPTLSLLSDAPPNNDKKVRRDTLITNSRTLEKKLADFGVEGRVVEIQPGPVVTMYELEPAPGVKINKITTLTDDLALALRAPSIRIVAPIPGKAVVGIEIPNPEREDVYLKDVLDNPLFSNNTHNLPIALGKNIVGAPVIADLIRMPHLLIAGTTGSGKSVSLNAMICSILFKATPDEVKFIMIDPKRIELASYEGIPHLLHPVVIDPKKAAQVLKWAVQEMERRYQLISTLGAKNIGVYNKMLKRRKEDEGQLSHDGEMEEELTSPADAAEFQEEENIPSAPEASALLSPLPYIVIIIDELADLMMVAQRHVEESLARLAQMARAAGIHLILATQRPSVDVITGLIKANFRARISFQVSSKIDSRTILDDQGAEKLLGAGDMLFIPPDTSRLTRIHGAFVSDKEINRIVEYVRKQGQPVYDESITKDIIDDEGREQEDKEFDEKYDEAVELVTDLGQASISLVQRYLKIGYNRAARIIEQMEKEGIVGPADGAKPRKILAQKMPK
ncbi:MAG: DNA translocase FtsK 4TM domain-containing protein [Syntrophobacterales bacterium]|jgi:S-DNA-T family DNA segregation ATPase FtsK/SpoIIIE|nr:DNA translocase FtsK 4TM domain-containing protein [Syntrophobacterales bacterium]